MTFTVKFTTSDKQKTVDIKLIEELSLIARMFDAKSLLINFDNKIIKVCEDYTEDED